MIYFKIIVIFSLGVYTEDLDFTPFQEILSPSTYQGLINNTDADYKNFSLDTMKELDAMWSKNVLRGWELVSTKKQKLLGCYTIHNTYRDALRDLTNYYEYRMLYLNTLEYEVGYLVHEVIFRYRKVLELYHMVTRRQFFNHNPQKPKNYAPIPYIFYVYTNILETCNTIMHLCNMLHELPFKYEMPGKGVFDDYHLGKESINMSEADASKLKELEMLENQKKRERQRKAQLRQYKKQRKWQAKLGLLHTTTRSLKKKSTLWPLDYGWSIEYW